MLFQGIGGGISMWLYINGISVVFSLLIAVFLVVAMWVGPRLLDIERPCKDSPTLLLDGIVVIWCCGQKLNDSSDRLHQ